MQNHFPRAAGIFLHVTSLPGDFGIGDLGPDYGFEIARFPVRVSWTGDGYRWEKA